MGVGGPLHTGVPEPGNPSTAPSPRSPPIPLQEAVPPEAPAPRTRASEVGGTRLPVSCQPREPHEALGSRGRQWGDEAQPELSLHPRPGLGASYGRAFTHTAACDVRRDTSGTPAPFQLNGIPGFAPGTPHTSPAHTGRGALLRGAGLPGRGGRGNPPLPAIGETFREKAKRRRASRENSVATAVQTPTFYYSSWGRAGGTRGDTGRYQNNATLSAREPRTPTHKGFHTERILQCSVFSGKTAHTGHDYSRNR